MTLSAYDNIIAASSLDNDVTGLVSSSPLADDPSSTPNPPNITFNSDLFIALVIILVNINPDAPTNDPEIINTGLPKTNPAPAPAIPEYEFNRATTTGISAPPIGITINIPKIRESPAIMYK